MYNEEFELTKGQRYAGNITAGAATILCGLFLLLCGVGVFSFSVQKILLASILLTIGIVLLLTGIFHKNTVSIWLAFIFIIPGVVECVVKSGSATYFNMFPFYIAAPAFGSLAVMFYTREWKVHVTAIVIFGVTAGLMLLKTWGALGWSVIVPLLIVFFGLLILFYSLKNKFFGGEEE